METLFLKFQEQKTLLTNCSNSYKTLTNHFTNLQNSIQLKSQTLDSKFQTLDSTLESTLDSLKTREDSLPELENSLPSDIETLKNTALSEVSVLSVDEYAPVSDTLKSVCRRMDPELLTKLFIGKRRQSTTLRELMSEALLECVDGPRFVVEAVREFVEMKREKRDGLSDKRLACTMVVGGMFSPDGLKETGLLRRVFARKAVERAEEVLREWKEVADRECGGEGSGMGPSESAMFIEMAVGFGLKEKFDDGFFKKLMVEFCERRDMAKLGIPVFGDKVGEFIEEMVKNGKEVEAVYFAYESGLTDRFKPVSLLKAASRKSKINSAEILKKGNRSQAATDEANSMEMNSIKAIIKCVEDLEMEEKYPIENLKKRLDTLLQAKADRKKASTTSKSKRPHGGGARASAAPPSRHSKMQRVSNSSTTFTVPQAPLSPVSRYLGPYAYPSQTTYDYGSSYRGSHVSAAPAGADQVAQQPYGRQQYGAPGDYYGSQAGYAPYDYGASAATPAYPPPSYPQ